jgi:hypothetical protein
MSTKTSIKRIALVAVSALGFGLLSVMPAKANTTLTGAVSVGPVRVTFTGAAQDAVSGSLLTFSSTSTFAVGDLVESETAQLTVAVTQAPTAAAIITVAAPNYGTDVENEAKLGQNAVWRGVVDKTADGGVLLDTVAKATGDITFSANVAGTYKGTVTIDGDNNTASNILTASFSFTTTGAPASIAFGKSAVEWPAVNTVTATNTITLRDAAGNLTQSSTVDTLAVTTTSATNIALTTGASLTDTDLKDGTVTYTFTSNGTADSETITVTPQGTLPGLGVTAKTFTVKTTGYGVETSVATALTSPSATSVVLDGTAADAETAYDVDLSATSLVFTVSGYTAGAAYKIRVDNTGVDTVTAKDDTSNTTAATATGDLTLYGIVGTTGSVVVTLALTGVTANDKVGIGADNGDNNTTDASDALVTFVTSAYEATITTPAVTPSMTTTGAAINVAGTIADQFGNPLSGASVTVTGTVTTTDATPANLTGTATSAANGTWSLTLSAATALTTSVSLVATATKTGATIADSSASVVNLTASGSPASMTWSAIGDEDSYTALAPLSQYPAAVVPYTGSVSGDSDELYTISTGATDGTLDAGESCVAFTATTTPGSQVVFTGSAGVKFTKTSCATAQSVAKLLDSVTVASGTAAYAVATKTGANTVTMTSGTVSKTATFYAYNFLTAASAGDAIRNLSVDKSTLALNAGQIGFITVTATDAFGNLVKSAKAAAGAVVTVKASGQALLDGPALSRDYTTTDSSGNIVVGVIASDVAGTATISVSGIGAQLGSRAGRTSSTSTTDGTNGLTVSVATGSTSVTVTGNTADAATLAGEKADAATAAAKAAEAAAKAAGDAAVAAAQKAATDAVAASKAAQDAAVAAAKAAGDAAVAAAVKAALDAVAASKAAQDAAVAEAQAATEAAAEAIDASNAATDAANIAAEAADAATVAAEEARDAADAATAAVEELATQVSTLFASLKAQLTTLANTVAKIAKKVRA